MTKRLIWLPRGILLGLLALVGGAVLATDASAQYFGRNKVSYRTFDFKILHTEHFDLYYYEEEAPVAEQAGRIAERWYARLAKLFDHQLSSRQPLILYASHPHFEQTNAIAGELDEGTGGVTEGMKRRIVLPVGASLAETDHVIGHELVHAFQYDISGHSQASGGEPAAARLPLWFVEGMAEYFSIGPIDAHTAMWMRDAVSDPKHFPTIARLEDPHFFPYRFGHALWSYIGSRWGDGAIGQVLRAAARSGEATRSIEAVLGVSADSLSHDWMRSLQKTASRVHGKVPSSDGHVLVSARHGGGRYNLDPALSPDGNKVMFLSEREFFSMELFVADAHTGKVLRKFTKTSVDPHLQSLEFVSSSGAWSHDGKRYAFPGVRDGRPTLTLVDVPKKRVIRRLSLSQLGEILSLSWSPDNSSVVFSALHNGQTDLFTMKVNDRKSVKRLMNDLYADLQPAWSPDGTAIAFSTDRFTTNVDSLECGELRLGLYVLATGEIQALPALPMAKHLNPQWADEGRRLYCVADRGGVSNVYSLDITDGTWSQVTHVTTGVSGLTATSPAISVASAANRMVFTAYEGGTYNLYSLDSLATRRVSLGPLPDSSAADLVPSTEPNPEPEPIVPAAVFARRDSIAEEQRAAGLPVLTTGPDSEPDVMSPGRPMMPPPQTVEGVKPPPPKTERVSADLNVLTLIRDSGFGLSDTTGFRHTPYKASLSLDRVSQVNVGAGTAGGNFGATGGATLFWSDILGNHNLATYLEINATGGNFLNNVAAAVDYLNLRSSWNWGFELSQIPYITRQFTSEVVMLPGGGTAIRERDARYWQIERRVVYTVAHPFSRVQRIEFGAGYQGLSFRSEVETRMFSSNGDLLSDQTISRADAPTLHLLVASAALVHDNSFLGGTSPMFGSRYRLAVEPVTGDLHYAEILGDYRQYLMPVRPFTLAGRIYHYGRYGPDSQNEILSPLYLGYPFLVRGYDDASFTPAEYAIGGPNGSTFQNLFGSRLAVANAEFRFPVFGALGIIPSQGMLPIEAGAFMDWGVAWYDQQQPTFLGGTRRPVVSHGLVMRANLFGYLIAEIDMVQPHDRPFKGAYWQFSFQPGF